MDKDLCNLYYILNLNDVGMHMAVPNKCSKLDAVVLASCVCVTTARFTVIMVWVVSHVSGSACPPYDT